jgi:hypothetical protein
MLMFAEQRAARERRDEVARGDAFRLSGMLNTNAATSNFHSLDMYKIEPYCTNVAAAHT